MDRWIGGCRDEGMKGWRDGGMEGWRDILFIPLLEGWTNGKMDGGIERRARGWLD